MFPSGDSNWRQTEDGWRLLPGVYIGNDATPTFDLESVRRSKSSKTEINRNVCIVIPGASRPHDGTSQERCDAIALPRQPHLPGVKGIGMERRIFCGLSSAIEQLDINNVLMETSGTRYCCEMFIILLKENIQKVSGTTLRAIFGVLEMLVSDALNNETNIKMMERLLATASESLATKSLVGSKSLLKRHRDVVNNLTTKLQNFQYSQREDDHMPQLLDLPKECLYNILRRISDPRDLANVGATCSYMHDLVEDPFIWQYMCLFHFTDKQLYQFICDEEYMGVNWLKTFQLCFKQKKRLRVNSYANELYFCNLCRAIYWKDIGHPCRNADQSPCSSPLLPKEFIAMLCL